MNNTFIAENVYGTVAVTLLNVVPYFCNSINSSAIVEIKFDKAILI